MPILHNPCGDSGAHHPMSGGWQGGGIYAIILSIRTIAGGSKHRPRPDWLHCWLCTMAGYSHNGIGRTECTTTIPSLRMLTGYYRMAVVFRRDDFEKKWLYSNSSTLSMVPRWVWTNGPLDSSHGCLRLHMVSGCIKILWCTTQSPEQLRLLKRRSF